MQAPRSPAGGNPEASVSRAEDLERRGGRAYGRIAPRPVLEVITGISTTSVHLRANGERRFSLRELDLLARSPDPRVNPMHPIAEAYAVVGAARRSLPVAELLPALEHRSREEQRTDGAEDVTQLDLQAATELLRQKGLVGLSFTERERVRKAVFGCRDVAVAHLANLLAYVADLEALATLVDTRH